MAKQALQDEASIIAHFPTGISKKIEKFATEVVFLGSRYIFTRRAQGIQFGYCTHCKREYMTKNQQLKHHENTTCERCKSHCVVQSSGMGRQKLVSEAYFVYYEKSRVNPEAIIARGFYAVRDYSAEDYYKIETEYQEITKYLYEPGRSYKFFRYTWGSRWEQKKAITSETMNTMKYKACFYSPESIRIAVKGTPFQYSTWEQHDAGDRTDFFNLAAKYPCVEYLTKLGLKHFIEAKLRGYDLLRTINWRGKTLPAVLRLDKTEIKQIRQFPDKVDARTLDTYHRLKRVGSGFTLHDAHVLKDLKSNYYEVIVNRMMEHMPESEVYRYILKQVEKCNTYNSGTTVVIEWRDYINECKELAKDTSRHHIAFPNNLHDSHLKTSRKVQMKKDKKVNALISARIEQLQKYCMQRDGLLIRPAASSIELFDEGKILKHCVGGYVDRYAKGETNIFVIREVETPEKPFYTLEVNNGRVIQCEGLKRCKPTDEVQAFLDHFVAKKLKIKKQKKVGIAV